MRSARFAVVCCIAVAASGCGSTYYRVTDPTTGRIFYTTSVEQLRGGSVTLRDAGTGRTVTLQNSEVQEVKKEEFDTGRVQREPAPTPAPAPAPAPTPAPASAPALAPAPAGTSGGGPDDRDGTSGPEANDAGDEKRPV
jgi:hypothetical protein